MWEDADRAQKLLSERTALNNAIDRIKMLEKQVNDTYEMIEVSEKENEADLLLEAETQFAKMESELEQTELESLLSQEGDKNDAFLEIHSGAGGTESQDWAV